MRRFCLRLLLTLALASTSAAADNEPQLSVFVSVLPIKTFVDRVAGNRVQTQVMVLPGASPATYDPSPKQIATLADADLYVRVGVPFEEAWMPRIRAANPTMPIVDLRDGLRLRRQEQHEHGDDHGHTHAHTPGDDAEIDPHVWTSPANARTMLRAIRDTLSELDPAGAQDYAANQQGYDAELAALDTELAAMLTDLENRTFLVYHPAWGYFADAYGLEQIPIERAGKESGPRRLSALIEQARAADAHAIFVQPEFDRRTAQQVARSIGGRVEVATPLAADYAANLRRFAAILTDAYRPAPRDAASSAQ